MALLTVILVVIAIALMAGLLATTAALYNKREDASLTPLDIYNTLLTDQTLASVTRSLSIPTTGDIGTFGGYDWPDSKVSGVGGSLHMNNPTNLNAIHSGAYVPYVDANLTGSNDDWIHSPR